MDKENRREQAEMDGIEFSNGFDMFGHLQTHGASTHLAAAGQTSLRNTTKVARMSIGNLVKFNANATISLETNKSSLLKAPSYQVKQNSGATAQAGALPDSMKRSVSFAAPTRP